MPLVFVHGVANRPTAEQAAEIAQRDALFRALTFENDDVELFNPDWGSHAVAFSKGTPWIPDPSNIQAFGVGDASQRDVGLGRIAKLDGAQAVDLAVMAALEEAQARSERDNEVATATDKHLIELAKAAADYVEPALSSGAPKGIPELAAPTDQAFAEALDAELKLQGTNLQAFGVSDIIRNAVGAVAGWIGNGASDLALRAKRRGFSEGTALFLGDIFIYLRQRKVAGPEGTGARLFEPIVADLIRASNASRSEKEAFVVVGHSLGGVLLYDILTDPVYMARLKAEAPGFKIDAWLTVGSQPGFFADLGLYPDLVKNGAGRYDKPVFVDDWLNVYDYTDVFSFLCQPFFDGVEDFGYDTAVDLVRAHSAYFKRPSFYKRLQLRLKGLGHL